MARNIVTGIDVGTSAIRIVVSEYPANISKVAGNTPAPFVLAAVKKESRGLRRGYVISFDELTETLGEAFREAEKMAKIKIKKAFLGVGGITLGSNLAEGSIVVSRADLEITELDIKRAITTSEANLKDSSNKQIIHTVPLQFKLDGKRVLGRPIGLKGGVLEVKTLFISSLEQHLNDLVAAVEEAGVEVEDVIASPIAASFVGLSKLQKAAGCLLLNIGAETVSLVIFEEGIPISLEIFPIGSSDITNDIALGLKISLEEADALKIGARDAYTSRKKLDEIIEARLSDIFELIERHLRKIGRSALLPAGLVITGGGASTSQLADLAKEYLHLPAKVVPEITIPTGENKKINIDSSWSVAYGLCVLGFNTEVGESIGIRLARETKNSFIGWIRQLLP